MSEQIPIRQESEQALVREHLLQEEVRRKEVNRHITALLAFILPGLTGAISVLLIGSGSLLEKRSLLILAISGAGIATLEWIISFYLRLHAPKKVGLKWTIADVYSRHLELSALNPKRKASENDKQPT